MQKWAHKAASASSELQLCHLCHLSHLLPHATSKGIAIATLHMLLTEKGCLSGKATPSLWSSPLQGRPFLRPCPWLQSQAGGWETGMQCWGCPAPLPTFPRLQTRESGLVPHLQPGDCSWWSPEEHGEGVPLSKQMAPAPSLPLAALPFSGGMMAFCLPSCSLWGALCTAQHWGAQSTAKMGCTG